MPRATHTSNGRSASASRTKKCEVGRFDGEYKNIHFNTGDTVQAVMTKAGFSISDGEEINDDAGNTVSLGERAKETTYHVTGNFKNGK